jgi:hypothetical protein
MARGRTIFEILTGQAKDPPARGPYNPLGARAGQHAQLDVLDYRDELWAVGAVWSWDASVGRAVHHMADYVLDADGRKCLLRCVPRVGVAGPPVSVLLMTQLWPEGDGPAGWSDDVRATLEALNDEKGELYRYRDTPDEERYWRVGGAVPLGARVLVDDMPGVTPVNWMPYTFWDYHRVTKDEGGADVTEYLYGQLSGTFKSPTRVEGGDKTLVLYRGVEIDPKRVTIYGSKG